MTDRAAKSTGPADAGELPDAEAIARARKGDHEAFRVLVERYQTRVFRLAMRILRNEEAARDAVQEIFIKTYSSLRKFEGRSGFYTWLYRLAYNQCLDMRRRDRFGSRLQLSEESTLEQRAGDDDALDAPLQAQVAGPGVEYERAELRRLLAEAIDKLPDDARDTLVLRDVEGLSYAEIAEALSIPKGTVMSRLYYARRKVQDSLRAAGVALPGAGGGANGKGDEA